MTKKMELRFKDEKTKKKFEAEGFTDADLIKFEEHPMILSRRFKWTGYQSENGVVTEVEIR